MEDLLTESEVLHVAGLAKIKVSKTDIKKYQKELKTILNNIEKIKDIKGYDDEILISPIDEPCSLRKDIEGDMLDSKEVLINAPRHNGNYIEVPVVINE